jgi:hypothetical protein
VPSRFSRLRGGALENLLAVLPCFLHFVAPRGLLAVSFLRFDQEQALAGMFVSFLGIAACFGQSSFILETFCAVGRSIPERNKVRFFLYGPCVHVAHFVGEKK